MDQTNHFYNIGFGWMCKHCSTAETERRQSNRPQNPQDKLNSQLPLASWTDADRNALICPRCGIQELVR